MEDGPSFITVTATGNIQHKRSVSNQSMMSGGVPNHWTHNESDTSGTNQMQLRRTRRSRIPDKPNYSLNLWSIMKNCIGKDLSRIPMPVNQKNYFVHIGIGNGLVFNIVEVNFFSPDRNDMFSCR
ncbi:hypothetical protein XENOCAPTIV_005389 [Xenoophorus captivus]|uniref:Uncharacterized protein n=1 Tax=Xenoophorus captivus TaxID=1517983 RepID=A0ABV0QVQ6_9TELE